ncbi:uncharacterized protein LOC100891676 [Strongylocentrotus purpuratus]|uniref:Ig-like domain-containing protein n=1 Tax=Strongylocentrotus purpuratus TaxID=7668 RepID=A0A7M7PIS7_STRPU|nr:uncharacterized protein LOC100891676 [Strongylocentrotus purpuratus]
MGNSYILIIVSVLASVSSSHGSQDQVITTSFGKNATLQCPIANQGSGLRSLYWKKDGTAIYSLTSDGVHTSGKYSVTDTTSLVIPDVTESDAGNYSCIVAFRKPYGTITSDIMQLYVIEVSVSHCKDTGQEVNGCSCYINGSNITSLECSASGFPHPPVIKWEEEDRIVYLSSSVDLTRIRENTTLTCKARDVNLKGAVEDKTVCVYFAREVTSTGGSPVETTTASVNVRAYIAAIVVLFIALILLLLERYIRKKGKAFQWYKKRNSPKTLAEPDEPPLHGKDIDVYVAGCVEQVLEDTSNWKNSKESSVEDLPTSQPESTSIVGGTGDVDFPPEDYNQNVVVGGEQQFSLVGLVLLDDLSSAPEETKESIKAASVALVVDPYKITHVDPNVAIHSLLINMNETLQRSVNTGDLDNHDAEFDRDRILDERDRDEFEVSIPEPESQEVTDESQILDYQGNRVIQPSIPMSAMSNSVVPFNPRPYSLRGELQSSERAATSNVISRITDGVVTGNSGLRDNGCLKCSTGMLLSVPMQSNTTPPMASSSVVACNPLSSGLLWGLQSSERAAMCNTISPIFLGFDLERGYSGLRGNICLNCSTVTLTLGPVGVGAIQVFSSLTIQGTSPVSTRVTEAL